MKDRSRGLSVTPRLYVERITGYLVSAASGGSSLSFHLLQLLWSTFCVIFIGPNVCVLPSGPTIPLQNLCSCLLVHLRTQAFTINSNSYWWWCKMEANSEQDLSSMYSQVILEVFFVKEHISVVVKPHYFYHTVGIDFCLCIELLLTKKYH